MRNFQRPWVNYHGLRYSQRLCISEVHEKPDISDGPRDSKSSAFDLRAHLLYRIANSQVSDWACEFARSSRPC